MTGSKIANSLSNSSLLHHVMSHDDFWQYILNPMLNPVSCDRRGNFCMFFLLILALYYLPHRSLHRPKQRLALPKLALPNCKLKKNIASAFTTPRLFRVAGAVDSNLMHLSKGAIIPPWGCFPLPDNPTLLSRGSNEFVNFDFPVRPGQIQRLCVCADTIQIRTPDLLLIQRPQKIEHGFGVSV